MEMDEAAQDYFVHLQTQNDYLRPQDDDLRSENGELRRENDDLRRRHHQSVQIMRDLVSVIERLRTAREGGEEDPYDYAEIEIAARLTTLSAAVPLHRVVSPPLPEVQQPHQPHEQYLGGLSNEDDAPLPQGAQQPQPMHPLQTQQQSVDHQPVAGSVASLFSSGDADGHQPPPLGHRPRLSSPPGDDTDQRFNSWLNGVDEAPSFSAAPTSIKTEPTEPTTAINDGIPSLAVSRSSIPLRSTGKRVKHPRVPADISSGNANKRRKTLSRARTSSSSQPSSATARRRQQQQQQRENSETPPSSRSTGPSSRHMSLRSHTRAQSYESELREAVSELDFGSLLGEDGDGSAADASGLGETRVADEAARPNDGMELDLGALEERGDDDYVPEESSSSSDSSESEDEEQRSVPVNTPRSSAPSPAPSAPTGWTAVNRPKKRPQAATSAVQAVQPQQMQPQRQNLSSVRPSSTPKPSQATSSQATRYSKGRITKRRFAEGTVPGVRFEFFRKPKTVIDTWREWHEGGAHGNPPLGQLEEQHGSAWRARPGDKEGMKYASNYVSVRRMIVEYVDRSIENRLGSGDGLVGQQKRQHEAAARDAAIELCVRLDELVKGRIQKLTDFLRVKKDPFTDGFDD